MQNEREGKAVIPALTPDTCFLAQVRSVRFPGKKLNFETS